MVGVLRFVILSCSLMVVGFMLVMFGMVMMLCVFLNVVRFWFCLVVRFMLFC